MRLVIGTVVASIPPETDVGQLTMSGTFCCFSSPGLLTFYDWSIKSSLVVSLPDNLSLIGLCCCQSKSRIARRVFGLTNDGRILCWRYDTEFNSIPCNHIYTYNENDWPRNVTIDVAYLIADETSDLLVIVIPNRFLHVFSLRLNKMVGIDTLGGADDDNLVRSSLRLQFKPLQHYSRSSSDAVCNMWGLTDKEAGIEEITICLGTETFLDIWKIDINTEDRTIASNNDTPNILAEGQAIKDAGSTSTMRIPTKHKSWITVISSKSSSVVPLEISATNSIVITGDASGGVIVWSRKNLRHSVIRENWFAEKKAREDEAKALAAELAQAEKLRAAALVAAAQRENAMNSAMNSRNSSVVAPRSRTPSKHGGSRSRSPNKIGGPVYAKQGLAKWNMEEMLVKEGASDTEQEPVKSAPGTSKPGSSRKSKRNTDAEIKDEASGPTEPDDLTVSGLDEHIVLIDFGASGPITVIFIDSSLELVWIADASGAVTGANLDLTQRSLVKTRRLVVDLGWASELFWQRDEVTKHGIVRYVEKNRGVVMEWILHDRVSKVFQAASELDAPAVAGHRSLITCCTLLTDWGLLLTGGFDPTIDVWDIRQGQLVCTLEVPSKRFSSMALQTIAMTDAENKDEEGDTNLCSPIARLVTGHSSGDMHSFRLSLISTMPPKISASLAHTSTYSPMPVTDIVLSCKGTVAALCFGRLCIILHDCETNRSLRELNFEAPIDCIQSVAVTNIAVYTAALMATESSSSFYGSRSAAPSRLGAKSPTPSRSRIATSVAASRGVSNRSQLKNRRDDHLVVALQSKRVAKVIDLLGSGEAITSLDLGNHAKSLEPYAAIQGFVWQSSSNDAELMGVFVSQQENVLSYLPDVICFRKQVMSSSDTETYVVPAPTAVMLNAERRLGIDPVDAIAGGLQVTHLTWANTAATLAAVWSMRKVFFIQTVSFFTAVKQQEDARVIHVCYVPDRKVHVVFAKVLQNHSSDSSTTTSSSSVVVSSPPITATPNDDVQVPSTEDTVSMLPTTRRASAIVVLSDGHTMTINLDID